MAKVGHNLSFTFKIGPANSKQYAKVGIDVTEVDTEKPLQEQMIRVKKTLVEMWEFLDLELQNKIQDIRNG